MRVEIYKRKNWQIITIADIKELLNYKDLLYMLVKRDISVIYKQTVLGIFWALIKPVTQMVTFTLIFGKFAGIEKDVNAEIPYAVFTFIALVPWTYFSSSVTNATSSLISGEVFITKVYFPRVLIPLTSVISKLFDFVIAFMLMLLLLIIFGIKPSYHIIFIPALILIMITASFGIGLWLSALAIQYRDINQLMVFLTQILMFFAPVIWPIAYIPEKYLFLYSFYPMVGVIEGFRASILGLDAMPWNLIWPGAVSSFLLLVTGLIYFRNKENIFADVV